MGTTTAVDDGLPQLPFEKPSALEIPPMFGSLRAEQPIARVRTPTGDTAWMVTGHAEAQRLLADQRLGHSHPDPGRASRFSRSVLLGGSEGTDPEAEKTKHALTRKLLAPAFSARRVRMLRDSVTEITDGLLDQLAATTPPADLHRALSFPLPTLVISKLLGVPAEDRDLFGSWSGDATGMADPARAAQATTELGNYMRQLMAKKRRAPTEDVISDLVSAATAHDLSDDELVVIGTRLLFAGHYTTVARIDYGMALLLTAPDELDALRRDPGLIESAVEEILRMADTSNHGLPRYASADIEIDGVHIRAGDAILIMTLAANRDERTFADPDRFDIRRECPASHISFGYGDHYCIGASLARLELTVAFGRLLQRFPTLRLAVPPEELRQPEQRFGAGLVELPVTWDTRSVR
jgi:cytochrome P450